MKKKVFGKLVSAILAVGMIASMGAVNVFAETSATGSSASFDKYLVMDGNANTPTVNFTFTILAGTPVSADLTNNVPAVYSGGDSTKVTGGPTIADNQASFSPADTATTTVAAKDVVKLGTSQYAEGATLPDGQKYVSKAVRVDFSRVTFKEPGIYRYLIGEAAVPADYVGIIENDHEGLRVLDVYVESDGAALTVAGYVLHNSEEDIQLTNGGPYGNDKKNTGFTNKFITTDLTLKKTVSGNQAYRQKYFKFDVVIKGAPNAKYTVNLGGATSTQISIGNTTYTNPGTLTANASGEATGTFYLKHDEQVVIQGLPKNTKYSITEDIPDTEGYTVTAKRNNGPLGLTNKGTGIWTTNGVDDDTVVYNNYRNGTVPTGIMMDVAPYALMIAFAGAALLILISRKRRVSADQGL